MQLWLQTIIYYSEINQYGYLVHEVSTFMDMIFNGEMWRKANPKMTGIERCFCVQISQISESDYLHHLVFIDLG